MTFRANRPFAFLVSAGAALALAGPAAADKSFTLLQANVAAHVAVNGALRVDEQIEYSFSGSFSGGYREIPLRSGESVTSVSVLERGRAYRPGGCTELGCYDLAGTYGVADLGGRTRIVWHYSASNEARTFEIRYTLQGVAVAYDDVVDVNWKVWGDQWAESLGRLTATLDAPGKVTRAWGHPVYVRGDVQIAGTRAILRALDVPAHQFVELRALIPRSAFTSTAGMRVASGSGREHVVAQELADAAASARDHDRIEHLKRDPWLYLLYLLALGVIPGALVVLAVYWFFGRETHTGYDREYEQEPPTDTEPALVPTLLRAGRRSRLVRVHRHPVRPDPAWLLRRKADHNRAADLGRPREGADRRPRDLGGEAGRTAEALGAIGLAASSTVSSTGAPSACRCSATALPRNARR